MIRGRRRARVTECRRAGARAIAGTLVAAVAGGFSGACGSLKPPPPPAPKCAGAAPVALAVGTATYLAAELRACAFDVSCSDTNGWWSYDQMQGESARACIVDWNLEGLDGIACAPNAHTCDEWIACATHGHCAAWCAAQHEGASDPDFWACDGDDVIVCGNGASSYGVVWEDCAAEGMHCRTVGDDAVCTDGNTCSEAANPHCDDNHVISCDGTTLLEQSQDCAASGGGCVAVSLGSLGGTAGCVSNGEGCDLATYTPSCKGTVARGCVLGQVETEDCAAPGTSGACLTSDGQAGCVPDATECTATTPDACDGDHFVTCGTDQKLARVDCTTLGFRTCGDVRGRAACVP